MLRGEESLAVNVAHKKELLANLLCDQAVVYPASLAQQRLWFLNQLHSDSAAYNVHLGLWLRGTLDLEALRGALQEMVNRHESLRTSFRLEGKQLRQVVERKLALIVRVDDLTSVAEPIAEAYRLACQEVERPFDLREAPLFRARIFRVTAEDHVLLCTMHHIITDSWSIQVLARELSAVYEGMSAGKTWPAQNLPITYGDYSEWQHIWLNSAQVQQQVTYWKRRLENAPAVLEFQEDNPRPAEPTFKGASQTVPLLSQTVSAVKTLAVQWQATPFMVLLAIFKVLLYRYSEQPDLVVGVPVAGRNRVETEGLIGFFVNTLVLRDDLSANPMFADLLLQVRETTLAAFANSDVPFEKVVEAVNPERNLSYNPIFQVMFSMIKSAVRSNSFGKLTAYTYAVTPTTAIFDLFMTIIEATDGEWWVQLDYNTDLFHKQRIERMLQDYLSLLQAILQNPKIRILDSLATICPASLTGPALGAIRNKQTKTPSPASEADHPAKIAADEDLLLGIWKKNLRLDRLTIHDNFFDVGGHSLLAASLIADVQSVIGRKVPVSAVFHAPTVSSFARWLRHDSFAVPDSTIVKLNLGVDSRLPLFTLAIPGVDSFGFRLLADHISPVHPVYKVQAAAPVVTGRPLNKQEKQDLAEEYINAIRSAQPHGPYCLAAMCDSVPVAQEAILQLELAGEEVGLFAIFDTWVLENSQIPWLWAVDYYRHRLRRMYSLPISEKVAVGRRVLGRWFFRSSGGGGSGWKHGYWPGEDFQPPRFHAPVLLFKRPRQPYFYVRDPKMGWGDRSLGGVEICEIDCGHVEMLREPYVRLTGQVLGSRLEMMSEHLDSLRGETGSPQRNQPAPPHDAECITPAA